MKKKIHYVLFLLFTFLIVACSDEDNEKNDDVATIIIGQEALQSASISDSLTFTFITEGIDAASVKVKSSSAWCMPTMLDDAKTVKVITTNNSSGKERSATITLFYEQNTATIIVTQLPKTFAPDVKEDFKLTVSGGKASANQSGEDIEKSFDGNMSTLYHSPWNADFITDSNPITLTYNFSNIGQVDYLIYHPRSDGGSNGRFKDFDLYVSYDNQLNFYKLGSYSFNGSSVSSLLSFATPLQNPTNIKFVVKGGSGNYVSCAEMEFYRKSTDAVFDYTPYFADKVCSVLKSGITLSQIKNISDTFFRDLALEIYNNKYDKEFRVQEYQQYQYPEIMGDLNKTSTYSLLDNPTGIYTKAGEIFTVITDLKGQNVSLTSIDLSTGYDSGSESFLLKDGVNKITSTIGGLLYVKYHTKDKTGTMSNININIIGGTVNGYFDSQKHTQTDWNRLLNKTTYKDFDVLGKYAHVTFPTESFKANTSDGKALIDKYDELVYLEQDFMGLVKYNKMFQNRMYFHVDYVSTGNMYATAYRTGYVKNTMNLMTTLSSFKSNIWGPAHEVGHCNQTRPGMRWFGMGEVTNNIHSLYVQTSFGNTSRLITDGCYNNAFANYTNKNIAHHLIKDSDKTGIYNGVFYKLIPFWQLKLYLIDVLGKENFYKDLYELYRTTSLTPSGTSTSDGFYQLKFVEYVCQIANLNLIDFFQAWGFLTAVDTKGIMDANTRFAVTQADIDAVKNRIAAKGYPVPAHNNIYDITDNNVASFK